MARFDNREERERYMDGLERQMERRREEISRGLERTMDDPSGLRPALERLRKSIPGLPRRGSGRDAGGRETPAELVREQAPPPLEGPRVAGDRPGMGGSPGGGERRPWWRRIRGG